MNVGNQLSKVGLDFFSIKNFNTKKGNIKSPKNHRVSLVLDEKSAKKLISTKIAMIPKKIATKIFKTSNILYPFILTSTSLSTSTSATLSNLTSTSSVTFFTRVAERSRSTRAERSRSIIPQWIKNGK